MFDCSAKTDGVSLKDVICAGPKLQKDLFDVLIRFRRNPVALACDIKEMCLQVEIEESDRLYFQILWRDLDTSRNPDSAPTESQFVAQENARKHQEEYPLAAETVLKSTYMDDSLDSVETVEDGIQLYRQLDSLWGIAGMPARKWISNAPEVVSATPKGDSAPVSPSESFCFLSPTFVFSDALHVKYRNKVLCFSESSILGKAHAIYIPEFLRVWVLLLSGRTQNKMAEKTNVRVQIITNGLAIILFHFSCRNLDPRL